jgi:hypothetical protein
MSTILETGTKPLGPRDAGLPLPLDEFDEAEFDHSSHACATTSRA